jgi:hypothetical protein
MLGGLIEDKTNLAYGYIGLGFFLILNFILRGAFWPRIRVWLVLWPTIGIFFDDLAKGWSHVSIWPFWHSPHIPLNRMLVYEVIMQYWPSPKRRPWAKYALECSSYILVSSPPFWWIPWMNYKKFNIIILPFQIIIFLIHLSTTTTSYLLMNTCC